MKTYLSPSRVACYEMCPRKYHYEYVLGWKPQDVSATLEFGSAVHAGGEAMLKADAIGQKVSPVDTFVATWRNATATKSIKYSKDWDAQAMESVGTSMLLNFASIWAESGNQVMLDKAGEPLVERAMSIDCGDGVILRMKMDLVYMDANGQIVVADLKTPRAESPEDFAYLADQTCAYQVGVESTPEFGIECIDAVQFIELLKLKTKPRVTGMVRYNAVPPDVYFRVKK
jgi:CRISPR/Cas system-associated exonuclease Cas4 (RecB family)